MRAETVGATLEHAAARNTTFLRDGDGTITFAEFDALAGRVAAGLLARGVSRGDRIGLLGLNTPQWLAAFFGAARIGAVVVPLNVRYRERELSYMLGQSGARLVISLDSVPGFDFAAFYESAKIPAVHFGAGFDDLTASSADPAALASAAGAVRPDDPLMILYTSGTTGRPKGAVITHRGILASAHAQADHCGMTEDDVLLGHLPFNHVGGITCTLMTALVSGGSVALLPAFSPDAALRAIERHRVTYLGAVPTMYVLMLGRPDFADHDVSSVRMCVAGGSNVEPALADAIRQGFPGAPVYGLYGLSESSGACVLSPLDDDPETVSRTLGAIIGDFEARVVGPDGGVLPPGEAGELQIRGGCVAAGYWDMPSETAEVFSPDGWLATGDMVEMEPDGHLVLRGRKKEMYIQGGFNVYPVEIENVLTAHPKVAMAAGIGVPDDVLGEVGRFYIVPSPESGPPTEDELAAYCRDRLADYKVPRQFVITAEVPLTPVGKIHKALLKERDS
ncbi:class I adenylate-forming enzyme family protein [Actinomadura madurae]|uniref:Fatty-acyl-CoA synthase n=1 Tax=Actinomadura madurae TaxID=1993 RepID=A0A1I5XRQ5_9ACTN|nr:AMP-binding protein [Actinomadura madurae]SFQ34661.1 fatty-acyl-CoA synthase [Actinomadura madurae]SPT58158.1 Short-chain-fatty-acid--CoA ligase [Actinomadura madurae]